MKYIYQQKSWPQFSWNSEELQFLLGNVRALQGRLSGKLEALGFPLKEEAILSTLSMDILKSNEIEGELLSDTQVRSSVARRLGMNVAGMVPSTRNIDGVVDMMVDATQNCNKPLSKERLFRWHRYLFSNSKVDASLRIGKWRNDKSGPMVVLSGAMGRERIHFQAPAASDLEKEIRVFLKWFNEAKLLDPVLKAGIAHLWFVTLHPFDDGNGRIARAIADMCLSRGDEQHQRYYSMSAQIMQERKVYYQTLENTQKGNLDITDWLEWFIACIDRALSASDDLLSSVLLKADFWKKHQHTKLNDRQKKVLNKMLDHFDGNLNTSKWAKMNKCSADTALRDIQDLLDKKVLKKNEGGGRNTSYVLG